MWHEARKQERKIRGMMVDYRRRAERRRDFYEKIKADPTQFLQLHGRQCKIHLDPSVASAADSPATMMPWQGQRDNLIDRFDVRAHLDFIPFVKKEEDEEVTYEERQINYERYRIIAQNSFLCISEEKFLKQLHMEEQFGYTEPETKKKKGGATIGFNYEDGSAVAGSTTNNTEEQSDDNSDSDLDVDLYINVSKVDQYQAHEMNKHGLNYGMSSNDFYSFLTDDMEEAENNRLAREEEHEKALFSGRKSRRERRAHREKRLANRVISPPSYAARSSPTYPHFRESKSPSRSPTPDNSGKITYITSFGEDEEVPTTSKLSYAHKVKYGKKPNKPVEQPASRRVILDKPKSGKWDRSYKRKRTSRSSSSRSPSPRRYNRSNKRSRSNERKFRRRSYSRSRDRSKKYRSRRSTSSSSSTSSTSSSSSSSNSSKSRSKSKLRNVRPHRKVSISTRSSSSSSSSSSHPEPTIKSVKRSKSPSIKRESPPKVTVQRYYGRKRSDQSSSSDFEAMSDKEKNSNSVTNQGPIEKKIANHGNAVSTFKKSVPVTSMSLQERLKKKRQALLNKQFKADKLAEQIKSEREKQEQQNREDELREMAIKLRRRQREIRHAYDSHSSKSSSESEDVKSVSVQKSRSDSPSDKAISQELNNYQEAAIKGRGEELKIVKEKTLQSSPKLYNDSENKNFAKEDKYKKKENKKEDHKREGDDFKSSGREKFKNKSSASRSLVDY